MRKKHWVASTACILLSALTISNEIYAKDVSGETYVLQSRVSASADDAEERESGSMYINSSDLELVEQGSSIQKVGVRFTNITLPDNAIISKAYIQFKVDEPSENNANITIHGESTVNAPSFADVDNNISDRTHTNTSVLWSPAVWDTKRAAGEDQRTPDLSSIIQEIISETGLENNNAISFILSGIGTRVAEAYDGDQAGAPLLYLEYTIAQGTEEPIVEQPVIVEQSWVSASADDAEEFGNGSMYLNSSDLELVEAGSTQTVGVRFANITIPDNAIISKAYIQFKVDEPSVNNADLTIHGERTDNAPGFTNTDYNISDRTKTNTSALWSPAVWDTIGVAGEDQRTPDLSSIVQEIISTTGWESENAIAFILTGAGTRIAESYDGDQAGAPRLYLEYTTDGSTATPVVEEPVVEEPVVEEPVVEEPVVEEPVVEEPVVEEPVVEEPVVEDPIVEEPIASISQPAYYVAPSGDDSNNGSIDRPWGTINASLSKLEAGDTLYLRGGTYYESDIDNFPLDEATASARITIKNHANETVIVNGGIDLSDERLWEQEGNTDKYRYIDALDVRYTNLSQDGQPLRLMTKSNTNDLNELNGEGQWIRDDDTDGIWVQTKGGGNPGKYNIEISSASRVFSLRDGADFITIEGITVENAYYPIQVRSDHVELKNLVVRNSYGDGIKVEGWNQKGNHWDSEHGLIEDTDIYYFGESAIDVTGGDYWTIRGNRIHDSIPTRSDQYSPGGFVNSGIMIKNENIGMLIEDNIMYDMFVRIGAIILGGNTYYEDRPPVEDAVVRNNEFRNITGPYVISFSGAVDSTFESNLIENSNLLNSGVSSSPDALIQFREGYCSQEECEALNGGEKIMYPSEGNQIINNTFKNNAAKYNYKELEAYGLDNDRSTIIENNTSSNDRDSYFDHQEFTPRELIQEKGYD